MPRKPVPFGKPAATQLSPMVVGLPQALNKMPQPKGAATKEDILKILQKGIDLHRAGQQQDAEYQYQLILRDHPDQPDALGLMGILAADAHQYRISVDFLERAVKHRPRDPVMLNNLANAYIMSDSAKLAIPLLKKAIRLNGEFFEAVLNLARAKNSLGRSSDAIAAFDAALKEKPGNVAARVGRAQAKVDDGEIAEAEQEFRAVIAERPDAYMAYYGLSATRKFAPNDPEAQAIEDLLVDNSLDGMAREHLHHAAGKIFNDQKRFDKAIEHFSHGKQVSGASFKLKNYTDEVNQLIDLFTPDFFERRRDLGDPTQRPVFIVGMPRSSTTLTEQIIASHPLAYGAGELPDIYRIGRDIMPTLFKEKAEGRKLLRARNALQSAKIYKDELATHSKSAERVTDKMPHNFMLLGMIYLLFPNAKIVHCLRDPMENCVSCFMNKFNEAHGYNTDLKILGEYYQEYRRLMDHW